MSIGNLRSSQFQGLPSEVHSEGKMLSKLQELNTVTISRDRALIVLACVTAGVAQVAISALGIAEKMNSSHVGWSLAGISAALTVVPISVFFCSKRSHRTPNNFLSNTISPILWNTAPFVCGILAGTGNLSGRVAGIVSLSIAGGLAGLVGCCGACAICCTKAAEQFGNAASSEKEEEKVSTALLANQLSV